MKMGTFVVTMGVGMAAGATAAMMLPKKSPIRKAADSAAKTMKQEAKKLTLLMMQ